MSRHRQSVIVLPGPVRPSRDPFQFAFQSSQQEPLEIADKVAVDIVRMVFLFDERSVDENLGDSDSLKFRCQNGQILNELCTPRSILVQRALPAWGSTHQPGCDQRAGVRTKSPTGSSPYELNAGRVREIRAIHDTLGMCDNDVYLGMNQGSGPDFLRIHRHHLQHRDAT